jgi:signal transduction histidine kinase
MGRTPGPWFGLPHHRVAGRHQRQRGGRCVSWPGVSRLLASARGLVLCGLALAGAGLVLALAAPLVFAGLGAGFLLNPPPWMSPGLRAAPFAGLAVSLFLFPSVLLAVRRLANQARRLAAAWCGVPVAEPYRARSGGQKLGWLFTDPATWRDLAWITVSTVGLLPAGVVLAGPWLLRGYGRAAGLLLAPTRQAEIERLAGARAQAVAAAEAERRRMERDLHDGLQPRLVALAVDLGLAEARFEKDPDGSRLLLARAHRDAKTAIEELRRLVRGIHPSVLDGRGLDAALSALVAGCPVPVGLHVDLPRRPDRGGEAAAYYVAAEAVTNVAKHAGASRAQITVAMSARTLRIVVEDDGTGGARLEPGGGLAGLAARIGSIDGTFAVCSPPGGPTRVEAVIPCER